LRSSNKGAVEGGSIHYLDKCVNLNIFAQRDENEDI
jgi:hypothetical protein